MSNFWGSLQNINRTANGQRVDSERTTFFIKQIEQKDVQIQLLQQIIEKNQIY